ncbi:MAG: hypothetical protein AAF601_10595 [Pseudomonadota bacterium]
MTGLCLAFGLCVAPAGTPRAEPAPPQQAEITLDRARVLARQALARGDLVLAIKLARGLLEADPDDANAHMIVAVAMARAGEANEARKSAARAYRISDTKPARMQAAQLAAKAALHDNRPTLTQLWLRRAALNVADDVSKDRIATDYARVRTINPLSFRINAGLRPSNNVNNGADSALQVIDGVPIVGTLSGGAQALEGTIGTVDIDLSYRLRQSARSVTRLGGRFYMRRVWLSSSAKAQAPGLADDALDSTYVDVSLSHAFALGAEGNTASAGVRLGRAWAAGDEDYDFVALSASRSVKLGDPMRLSFAVVAEERDVARDEVFDQTRLQFNTRLSRKLQNGDRISLSYAITDTDADHVNLRSMAQSLRGSYAFEKPLGPAKVSTALTLGRSNYDDFRVGFIRVPGGREDTSVYGDVTFFFHEYDYGGFAPSVRLRAGRRDSNVSRYDSTEVSVNFQIRSTF